MEHTKGDLCIRKYIANKGYQPKLRKGAIVQCETNAVISKLMTGYAQYSTLNEPGRMLFTDRHFKSSYNRHCLPKYIYSLVEQVATDTSCENNYYLDIIEVTFYGEHLLRGFGKRCSPKLQMWEYQVNLIRNRTDSEGIDIEGVEKMFVYNYDLHHWIKAVCPYCERTGCGYMKIYDEVQAVCSVITKMNVSQCAKRAMVKNWYQNQSNSIRIKCVDEDSKVRWPVEDGTEETTVAIVCREE